MGHYDSDYEDDAQKAAKKKKTEQQKAYELLEQALLYDDFANSPEQYRYKIKEAMAWLREYP